MFWTSKLLELLEKHPWYHDSSSTRPTHTSLSPIKRWFAPSFVNYKKGCIRLAVASDKVYQLLAHGRWFSPGIPASSSTKTGRHDIIQLPNSLSHSGPPVLASNENVIWFKSKLLCYVASSDLSRLVIPVNSKGE
jgi:hypothetical protein